MHFNQLTLMDTKVYHSCQLLQLFRTTIFEKKYLSLFVDFFKDLKGQILH